MIVSKCSHFITHSIAQCECCKTSVVEEGSVVERVECVRKDLGLIIPFLLWVTIGWDSVYCRRGLATLETSDEVSRMGAVGMEAGC